MTDVYSDELYNPNFQLTSAPSSTPATNVTLSPQNDVFSQRLQAANSFSSFATQRPGYHTPNPGGTSSQHIPSFYATGTATSTDDIRQNQDWTVDDQSGPKIGSNVTSSQHLGDQSLTQSAAAVNTGSMDLLDYMSSDYTSDPAATGLQHPADQATTQTADGIEVGGIDLLDFMASDVLPRNEVLPLEDVPPLEDVLPGEF